MDKLIKINKDKMIILKKYRNFRKKLELGEIEKLYSETEKEKLKIRYIQLSNKHNWRRILLSPKESYLIQVYIKLFIG